MVLLASGAVELYLPLPRCGGLPLPRVVVSAVFGGMCSWVVVFSVAIFTSSLNSREYRSSRLIGFRFVLMDVLNDWYGGGRPLRIYSMMSSVSMVASARAMLSTMDLIWDRYWCIV